MSNTTGIASKGIKLRKHQTHQGIWFSWVMFVIIQLHWRNHTGFHSLWGMTILPSTSCRISDVWEVLVGFCFLSTPPNKNLAQFLACGRQMLVLLLGVLLKGLQNWINFSLSRKLALQCNAINYALQLIKTAGRVSDFYSNLWFLSFAFYTMIVLWFTQSFSPRFMC